MRETSRGAGGFRKGRECRDQFMTLALLGQVKAVTKTGMFIDLKKAYDRVDRRKLWRCLKGMGLGGRLLAFLKAVYEDASCEVTVGEGRSEPFKVTCGLRQGCILSPL